jgi:hypothetical protein
MLKVSLVQVIKFPFVFLMCSSHQPAYKGQEYLLQKSSNVLCSGLLKPEARDRSGPPSFNSLVIKNDSRLFTFKKYSVFLNKIGTNHI